jgi:xylulose-5-phosphate/fructose-6-phosphate phosphoketolase
MTSTAAMPDTRTLEPELLHRIDAYVKPLVVGHWGTTPGQNFTYVQLNRARRDRHD